MLFANGTWNPKENETLLQCHVVGAPTPTLTYFWGPLEVSPRSPPPDHRVTPDSVLHISAGGVHPPYSCRVVNDLGEDKFVLTGKKSQKYGSSNHP